MRRKTTTTLRTKTPSQRGNKDAPAEQPADGAASAAAPAPAAEASKSKSHVKARQTSSRLQTSGGDGSAKAGGSATRLRSRRTPSGSQDHAGAEGSDDGEAARPRARTRHGLSLTTKMAVWFTLVIFAFCAVFSGVVVWYVKILTEQQIFNQGENLIIGLPRVADDVEAAYQTKLSASTPETKVKADAAFEEEVAGLQRIRDSNPLIHHIRVYTGLHDQPQYLIHVGEEADTYSVDREKTGARYANMMLLPRENWRLTVQEGQIQGSQKGIYVYDYYRDDPTRLGVSLAYSRESVANEVGHTVILLMLIGAFFVVAGLIFAYGLASTITRPINMLIKDLEVVAEGNLDHQTKAHSKDEIGVLAATFNAMTVELRKAQDRAIYTQRLEADLEAAREIQNRLLPKRVPNLPGIDLGVMYESAKQVGGDYYDFIPVDREHLGFVIADVSGKGVPAAMVMATTRTLLRLYAVANPSTADTLSKVNRELTRDLKRGMFVTTLYMILNPVTRELSVSSAGHNPLIVYRARTKAVELKNPNGIALGFDGGPIFNKVIREEKLQLEVGDRVVIYTDGVTESMSPSRKEWGSDTLYEFTRRHADVPSAEFVSTLREALRLHQGNAEQHDDISYVTFRVES
ncbi:MAG TPA: SpoIIE family protein phosphatase [Planctomycetota bacterium]|nr:SpoIIE family protein phosphatase [Planctomycetota bacterium]